MARPRSFLLWSLGFAAVVAAAAGIVLPWLVDVDSLRPAAEDRLSARLARPVSVGELRLSLWPGPGVRASGLRVAPPRGLEVGRAFVVEADGARLGAALLPLLRGAFRPRSFGLEGADFRLADRVVLAGADVHGSLDGTPEAGLRSSGRVDGRLAVLPNAPRLRASYELSVAAGRVLLERLAGRVEPFALDAKGELVGLRSPAPVLHLEGTAAARTTRFRGAAEVTIGADGPEARLDLGAPHVDLGELFAPRPPTDAPLSDLILRAELQGGTLRVSEASFEIAGGRFRGDLEARVAEPEAPFSLSARLDGVRVERLRTGADRSDGVPLRGVGSFEAQLSGRAPDGAPDRGSWRGVIRLDVRDGALGRVGVLRRVARILEGGSGGTGEPREETPFTALQATFRVADGSAHTDDLTLRSADLDLDGAGTWTLDGRVDLDLLVSFSRGVSESLVARNSRLKFRVDREGRLTVPLRIAGTLEAPEVRVDLDRILSEGVERILGERGGTKRLRKLWGGR